MYYNDIITQQNTHINPSTDITPLMQVTEIHGGMVRQKSHFMIEVRGQDGSYSRGFTSKIDWEASY